MAILNNQMVYYIYTYIYIYWKFDVRSPTYDLYIDEALTQTNLQGELPRLHEPLGQHSQGNLLY